MDRNKLISFRSGWFLRKRELERAHGTTLSPLPRRAHALERDREIEKLALSRKEKTRARPFFFPLTVEHERHASGDAVCNRDPLCY